MNRPNFLIFCADQMQAACLGCNGHPVVRTPNIDALAGRGVNFHRGYCNNPVCMPSRASMITGKTPRQHGLLTNGNALSADVPTVTQALVDSGYRTHAAGKLHLQPFGGWRGEALHSAEAHKRWLSGELKSLPSPYYGYQSADFGGHGVKMATGQHRLWLREHYPESLANFGKAYAEHGQAFRLVIPEEHHYNHWIADRSIDFIEGAGASPFFLFCSFPDPHFPFAACRPYSEMYDPDRVELPEDWLDRTDAMGMLATVRASSPGNRAPEEAEMRQIIAQTWGMITHVDHNIGRVIEALGRRGLADNTVVMFIADHGEYLGGHGLLRKGIWPYEELWRVPFIAAAPGRAPSVCQTPVSLLDLAPTFLDYAGIDLMVLDMRGPAPVMRLGLAGQSLRPYIEGDLSAPHLPLVMEYDEDFHDGALCRLRGLIDGDWKIVMYAGESAGALFHLGDDPLERRNLWEVPETQEQKARLLARLVERLAATDRFDGARVSGA